MPRYPKVRIAGLEASVVSEAESEKAGVYICADWDGPAYFADDLKATCAGCGRAVRHRPYGPKTPMKLCAGCAVLWVSAH